MVRCMAVKPNFRYSARMPRLPACTLPVSWVRPPVSAASRTAASSSSPIWLRPGISATASDLKLPYFAPVSELVRAESQAQPSTTPGSRSATATRVISPGLPSEPDTRRRCSAGSVTASSAKDTTAMSISNPTIASMSSSLAPLTRNGPAAPASPVIGAPPVIGASAPSGPLPSSGLQRHRPEDRAAAVRAARRLQVSDARPATARPDLVHGLAARRTGRAAAPRCGHRRCRGRPRARR